MEDSNQTDEGKNEEIKIWSDEDLLGIVDSYLLLHDMNVDGFVTWVEYARKT